MVLMLAAAVSGRGQMTTMGTDFWFTYLQGGSFPILTAYISAPRNCSVTLSMPFMDWTETLDVVQGVVTSVTVPRYMAYNDISDTVLNRGVHLVATDTVSVYISLLESNSFDEANVLPTAVLRDKYVIQTYPADYYGGEFALLATEDSTWVDIYLSGATVDGYTAGDTVSVFLDSAGKTYLVRSLDTGDLSGTRVEARDCKGIAVFHGNDCLYIPDYPTGGSCDHVIEQAVPTAYWGKEFAVVSSGLPGYPDRVRVTALGDNCEIRRNGEVVATIDALETYEYRLTSSIYLHGSDYVTTSTPASVNLYFTSSNSGYSDPSMVTVPPLDQAVKNITFNSSNTEATTTHYVNVVIRAQDFPYLRLDGSMMNVNFEALWGNSDYQFRQLELAAGSHTLKMVNGAGFIAYAYGMGTHESYAYSIGSSMNDLSNRLVVEGYTINAMSNLTFCRDDSLEMYIEGSEAGAPNQWYFTDGTNVTGDTVSHAFTQPGEYTIMSVLLQDAESCFPTSDTLWATIHVVAPDTTVLDDGTCEAVYVWEGDSCRESGTYVHHLSNRYGCDSVLILHLEMHANEHYYFPMEGCDSIVIDDRVYYADDSAALGVYTDRWGCDSVPVAVLHINHSVSSTHELSINEGDSLVWIDGLTYWEETDAPTWTLHTAAGCDSVIHLHLHLVQGTAPPPIDSSTLWVPNVFTPEESTNNYFAIYCNDLLEAHVYIYTRQGEMLTHFDGLTESWDGRYKGKICKSQPYVYLIEYVTKSRPDYRQHKIGTVLLLR